MLGGYALDSRLINHVETEGCPGHPTQLGLHPIDSVMVRGLLLKEANEEGFRWQAAHG